MLQKLVHANIPNLESRKNENPEDQVMIWTCKISSLRYKIKNGSTKKLYHQLTLTEWSELPVPIQVPLG